MATYFSDHFATTGLNQTSLPNPAPQIPFGRKHSKVRTHIVSVDLTGSDPATNDEIRFCTLKSGDRIMSLKCSADAAWDATNALHVGVHASGKNHDGAVIDADLFATALDIAAGFAMTDVLLESQTLDDEDIGKQLWQMMDKGAATYTEDPLIDVDITGTISASGAAGGKIQMVIEYTHGG
jgi:hypothetical protein